MTSITTLDLRRRDIESLSRLVNARQNIQVTHRGKLVFMLSAAQQTNELVPGSAAAKRLFLERTKQLKSSKHVPILDPNKSLKDLYREQLKTDKKYL
jgi:antitoxin (DNA-binding transcriptional repressor) of toxin-antitoxin stability system